MHRKKTTAHIQTLTVRMYICVRRDFRACVRTESVLKSSISVTTITAPPHTHSYLHPDTRTHTHTHTHARTHFKTTLSLFACVRRRCGCYWRKQAQEINSISVSRTSTGTYVPAFQIYTFRRTFERRITVS